jgi:DNA-directed RNA polymerase specialized sigma24 family protein
MDEKEKHDAAREALTDVVAHPEHRLPHEGSLVRYLSGVAYRTAHDRRVSVRGTREDRVSVPGTREDEESQPDGTDPVRGSGAGRAG